MLVVGSQRRLQVGPHWPSSYVVRALLPRCLMLDLFVLHSDLTKEQRRLAEITEMIHTASLVHDDVLDECSVRRGASPCPSGVMAAFQCLCPLRLSSISRGGAPATNIHRIGILSTLRTTLVLSRIHILSQALLVHVLPASRVGNETMGQPLTTLAI